MMWWNSRKQQPQSVVNVKAPLDFADIDKAYRLRSEMIMVDRARKWVEQQAACKNYFGQDRSEPDKVLVNVRFGEYGVSVPLSRLRVIFDEAEADCKAGLLALGVSPS